MQLKNDLLTYLKYVDAYLWFYDKEVIGFRELMMKISKCCL